MSVREWVAEAREWRHYRDAVKVAIDRVYRQRIVLRAAEVARKTDEDIDWEKVKQLAKEIPEYQP